MNEGPSTSKVYESFLNLSMATAPAKAQTARITYMKIPPSTMNRTISWSNVITRFPFHGKITIYLIISGKKFGERIIK
jgi:hypothetical protein